MSETITLLGTGTCQLLPDKMATSTLIELDNCKLVFDMGRGVSSRLTEAGVRQDEVEHIVISHFHTDHWSDLIPYLHAAYWSKQDPRTKDLHIYGPTGLAKLINRITEIGDGCPPDDARFALKVHEIGEPKIEISGHEFSVRRLPPGENQGVEFDYHNKIYALTGDAAVTEAEVEFLRDVDLAVIDAGHPSDDEVVSLAVQSQAKIVVCSHQYRELDEELLNKAAVAAGYQGRLVIGHDLMRFEI